VVDQPPGRSRNAYAAQICIKVRFNALKLITKFSQGDRFKGKKETGKEKEAEKKEREIQRC
jgi:hypothetical protein